MKKILLYITGFLLLAAVVLLLVRYYWVFGEGVKSGELNFLVHKGYVFKTYEGKLIQAGIRSRTVGSIESYEFEFSVTDKAIAERLMTNAGKEFDLHYKEYFGKVPWRGNTVYVVDSILAMREVRR
ncbi:MAG: hypothetical protein EOO02_11610 [Chitinophagaceae bacterium]|nr:MAG: hypothetical protein EOO02_11610 [Chitinophagaceae bacterium]